MFVSCLMDFGASVVWCVTKTEEGRGVCSLLLACRWNARSDYGMYFLLVCSFVLYRLFRKSQLTGFSFASRFLSFGDTVTIKHLRVQWPQPEARYWWKDACYWCLIRFVLTQTESETGWNMNAFFWNAQCNEWTANCNERLEPRLHGTKDEWMPTRYSKCTNSRVGLLYLYNIFILLTVRTMCERSNPVVACGIVVFLSAASCHRSDRSILICWIFDCSRSILILIHSNGCWGWLVRI